MTIQKNDGHIFGHTKATRSKGHHYQEQGRYWGLLASLLGALLGVDTLL